MTTITAPLTKTGIEFVGEIPWGTHFCHFFETKDDLLDAVLPFFKTGLEAGEFCLWVVADPLTDEEATQALRQIVPHLDRFLADGSIEIHPAREWYLRAGAIDLRSLIDAWDDKLAQALDNGFAGMRANASEAWLEEKDWGDFCAYEERLNDWIAGKRMVVFCSYPLATGGAASVLDVARTHNFAMAKRNGRWEVVETPEFREGKAEIRRLNEELQQRVVHRTAQLAAVNEELRARNRQQSAVAALGQTAIRSRDLGALLREAVVVAAETLGAEFAALGEWLPDDEGFRLCASVGWTGRAVGMTVPVAESPLGRHVLPSEEPIVVADAGAESRFNTAYTQSHGVRSAMGLAVRTGSRPWGVLTVHARRRGAFGPDEVSFLQSVANVLSLAIERDAVEVAQRREKETFQAIFDNIPVMISITDASARLWRVNGEWERTLGWNLEEAQRADLLTECYPDPEGRREVLEFYRRVQSRWADFRMRTRDRRAIETSWACFDISDGSRVSLGLDITERKQGEEAVRESEARFRQLAENINEVFWLADLDGEEMLYVSPAYERVFGRSRESLYRGPRSWLEAVHPEDRERVRQAAAEKRARGEMDETYRVVRADGTIRWVRDRGFPIRDASGQTYRYAGIAEDITDRRRAEEERTRLLESERRARAEAETAIERLRAIQSITESALARLALDDLLSELLARLRKALGGDFACVQLVNEAHDSLDIRAADGVALDLVAPVRVPIGQAVAGRIAADGRPRIAHDLSTTDVSRIEGLPHELRALLQGSMLGTPLQVEGRVIGVVSVASARSRRFTEEDLRLLQVVADRAAPAIERGRLMETVRAGREQLQALSRRLLTAQEEERRRLAVELHDELGQVLTAVKINLGSLARESGGPAAPAHLRDATASVDRAMERVRDLALDLRPSLLDDLGLGAAVRSHADKFARTTPVEAHLSIDAVPRLSSGLEIACFRVAQEALTNVARHAKARNVWVDLHLDTEALDLRVRDDGIGFDVNLARGRAISGASMGLLGMQERVSLAGGHYELSTRPEGGTEVRARFPLGEKARGLR